MEEHAVISFTFSGENARQKQQKTSIIAADTIATPLGTISNKISPHTKIKITTSA
jgi:hypothetical protein